MAMLLKAARVNAGLNQAEALERLNEMLGSSVAKSTLVSWEAYRTFPSALQFKALCEIYGTSMDDISMPFPAP